MTQSGPTAVFVDALKSRTAGLIVGSSPTTVMPWTSNEEKPKREDFEAWVEHVCDPVLPAARIACRPNAPTPLTTQKLNGSGSPAQNATGLVSRCVFTGFRFRHLPTTGCTRRGNCIIPTVHFGDWRSAEIGTDRSEITCNNGINNTSNYLLRKQVILPPRRLIPLSQVNQNLGLAGQIRNWAGFEFFGRS
jgi:hypothetical protein